jgi:hypothetical protein
MTQRELKNNEATHIVYYLRVPEAKELFLFLINAVPHLLLKHVQ